MIVENVNTASSKVYRLVSNQKILSDFESVLKSSSLVTKQSLVNIDFSTFCGFETLAFAVQTHLGRAIPVWANCITYPIKETEIGSQNKFVLEEIERFGQVLGFFPGFVFDRGFWIPELMKFFLDRKIIFYLRIKQGQKLDWKTGKKKTALNISQYTKDTQVKLFDHTLRLIISPLPKTQPEEKKEKQLERWYILTNDFKSDREEVLNIYAHRFEIEETFKDLKHICDLKKFFIQRKLTFRVLLMFNCLSFWIAFWCQRMAQIGLTQVNRHKKRSYFRVWWETIQREIRLQSLSKILKVFSG